MRGLAPVVAVFAGALLAIGGCGSDDDAPRKDDVQREQPPPASRPLADAWYEDPDGDAIPTHTELRIGTDPDQRPVRQGPRLPGSRRADHSAAR